MNNARDSVKWVLTSLFRRYENTR